jgi:hypothetical protein
MVPLLSVMVVKFLLLFYVYQNHPLFLMEHNFIKIVIHLAWLFAGKSLLEGFFLIRVPMMTMRGVFWQNWSNNAAVNLPQRWKEWSVFQMFVMELIFYCQLFCRIIKENSIFYVGSTRLQIWRWQRRIKQALRNI